MIISNLIKNSKKKINFYIFDSFRGLSQQKKEDNLNFEIKERFIGNKKFIEEKVLNNFSFIKIYEGWIPSQFYLVKNKKFSFIHIDLCMYQPTLESLRFFYPRLVKGGLLVLNGYNSNIFKGETRAFNNFFINNKYSFIYKHALNTCFVIK